MKNNVIIPIMDVFSLIHVNIFFLDMTIFDSFLNNYF